MQKYEKSLKLKVKSSKFGKNVYFCSPKMPTMEEGLVIRTTGSWYRVLVFSEQCSVFSGATHPIDNQLNTKHLTLNTQAVDCRLRGNYRLRGNKQTNPVAVGDRVSFERQADGTGVIHDVADRRNYIVRRATKLSKQTHVIAANIDRLCIVATLGLPRTSTGFIDRLLVTAEAYHIPAAIVFNKSDLLVDPELREAQQELVSLYRAVGYPVLEVSALTGLGLDSLRHLIAGRTVLFSGHSGVGKSALLNALCPGLDLRVGQLSDWSLKGRHTTTFAEIFPVQVGRGQWIVDSTREQALPTAHYPLPTYLIDTPGIKEFGMVDFSAQELSHFFPEMRAVLHDCHFANCTHRHEPRCAVLAALDDGRISPSRYQSYLSILDDIETTD